MDLEAQAKEVYVKEKAEYDKNNVSKAPVGTKKGKSKKAKAENAGPKRAWPPFFFFQEARRATLKAENPDKSHKELVGMLGVEWRALSEEQKKPYVDK